ncbi:MAG: hypothetical protein JWR40_1828, partial [Massilia sp.]|nr:hypothetical protein [Massilia sp.]
ALHGGLDAWNAHHRAAAPALDVSLATPHASAL